MKKVSVVIILPVVILLLKSTPFCLELKAERLLRELFNVPSTTGNEGLLASRILERIPEKLTAEMDNLGSVYVQVGEGEPRFALLAGMDEVGYFVSGITEQGYLTLDRAMPPPFALFDSFFHGHPMRVWTKKGPLAAVVAIPSVHLLSRERREEFEKSSSLDTALLDIGARSGEEVMRRGVEILDPVTPWVDPVGLQGGKIAGYAVGSKMCASLLLEIAGEVNPAELAQGQGAELVWMAQTKLLVRSSKPRASLGASRVKQRIRAGHIVILDVLPAKSGTNGIMMGKGPVLAFPGSSVPKLVSRIESLALQNGISLQVQGEVDSILMNSFLRGGKEVLTLALPVKFPGTPVEVVDTKDAASLKALLLQFFQERRAR